MFLQHKRTSELLEVLSLDNLYDPCQGEIVGRFHCGEEMQEAERFSKSEVIFPSGEPLPRCWLDPNYRAQAA